MLDADKTPEYRAISTETVLVSGYPLRFQTLEGGRQAVDREDLEKLMTAIQGGLELPLHELSFLTRVVESFSEE